MSRPAKIFFTADQHFCHRAIIEMAARPFADVEEMDRAMVQAWNAVVMPGDVVWHLGDFSHRGEPHRVRQIFEALNGTKSLIVGNHDKQMVTSLGWAEQTPFKHLVIDGLQVNLCHYAMRTWPGLHRGSLMLFGHSHSTMPGSRQTLDVGVDSIGFAPETLDQLLARMALLPRIAYDVGREIDEYEEDLVPDSDDGFQP